MASTARADVFYDLQIDNIFIGGTKNTSGYGGDPYGFASSNSKVISEWSQLGSGVTLSNSNHNLWISGTARLVSLAKANTTTSGLIEVQAALFAMVEDQAGDSAIHGINDISSGVNGDGTWANVGFLQGALAMNQSYGAKRWREASRPASTKARQLLTR